MAAAVLQDFGNIIGTRLATNTLPLESDSQGDSCSYLQSISADTQCLLHVYGPQSRMCRYVWRCRTCLWSKEELISFSSRLPFSADDAISI
jgi:hypothetical protein